MDYLTNEQAEIHPRVEEASNGRSRPGGGVERLGENPLARPSSPSYPEPKNMYLPLSKFESIHRVSNDATV